MAMSGIHVPIEVANFYNNEFKIARNHAYLILEIEGESIQIKEKGPKGASPEDFGKALGKRKEYCYGVYSGPIKIGYLIYGPEGADSKKAMIYASTLARLGQDFPGSYDCKKAESPSDVVDNLKTYGVI